MLRNWQARLRLISFLAALALLVSSVGTTFAAPAAQADTPKGGGTLLAVQAPDAACARGAFPFADVPADYWAYTFIKYLWCANAIDGTGATTFNPGGNATRGQLSKIIVLGAGLTINTAGGPHFSDVPASNPFYTFIETLYNRGAISGYADGTFRPNNDVTRGQTAKIITGAFQWPINTANGPTFSDVPASDPFYAFVQTVYNRGVISGYADNTFRPNNNITRAQIAKITTIGATAGAPQAQVRVIHASPDAPAVDVYVDSLRAVSNLAFGAATSFASVPAGTRNVRVFPAGADPETTNPVIAADLTLAPNGYYSVFAIGTLAQIAPLAAMDDLSPTASGQARVRIAHASPDAPAVDVAVQGGPVLFSNLPFGQISSYLDVAAGTYTLEVRVAGTSTVVLTIPNYALEPGKAYTVAAIGLAGGTPALTVLPLVNSTTPQAQVRVIHASPDAPAVDVYVDGVRAIQNLAFGAATPFTALPAGSRSVKVYAAGADPAISSPVINADLTLTANTYYSVFATGTLAEIAPLVTTDTLAPPASGQARVRVIHASPDAPAVDVAVQGGPVLFSNLAFRQVAEYIEVPAGTYNLEVRLAGTPTVVLPVPNYLLEAGKTYSIAAIGLAGGTPALTVLPLVNEPPAQAQVRVIHTSPDAPAVDVYVDGVRAIENLAFGAATPFTGLPVGNRNVRVYAAGADPAASAAVIDANMALMAGGAYSVFATGLLANIAPLVAVDDLSAPPAGQARVRVIHASPDAPAVDIAVQGGPVLFSNLAFRQVSAYGAVPAGTYNLEVRLAGTATVVLSIPNYEIQANRIYTVAAIGLAGGTPALTVLPLVNEAQP
jgi:uncharacterized protein (UPF0264 family)